MSDPVTQVERAMVAIRRSQARRNLSRLQRKRAGTEVDHAVFGLLDVLDEAGPATVTAIAEALTVDQPRASRLVARAVDAGLVRREADQRDGRRTVLVLTGEGRGRLDRVHEFRHTVFAEAMAGWSAEERRTFGRLLTEFVRRYEEISR
jgi:DNA-binding MarR family transcriptional regulator